MRKAFTLIELLIVVAIIAILAAIAVPNFLEAQVRAKVSRAKADMRTIATAVETYSVDNNKPPTVIIFGKTAASPIPAWSGPSILNSNNPSVNAVSPRFIRLTTPISYISTVFRDPFEVQGLSAQTDPTGTFTAEYDTFDYWSAFDFMPGAAFDSTPAAATTWRGAGLTSGGSWRVVSPGPDRVNFFGGSYVGAQPMPDRSFGLDYDPTNGTVSRGDIVRIGSGPGPLNPNRLPSIDRVLNKYNDTF